jgi:transcriptional regulator with XRE-family HTH domain
MSTKPVPCAAGTGTPQVSPPGAIGGAVASAARRAAKLTRSRLARSLRIEPATLRSWENGTMPLFSVPYVQLRDLARAVSPADDGAATVLGELLIAAQCDLLVTEMLAGSADYAELPPIDEGTPRGLLARDLLTWAFQGTAPGRYRHLTPPGCLYARADRLRLAELADDLRLDGRVPELAGYAAELATLLGPCASEARITLRLPVLPGKATRRAARPARWWFRRAAR